MQRAGERKRKCVGLSLQTSRAGSESHALCYPPASTPQCIQLGAQGTECWPILRARGPAQLHELMNLKGWEETTGSYVQLLFTVLKCKFTSIPPLLQSLPRLPTELRTKSHPLPCLPPSPGLLFPAAASAPISLFKCTKLIPTSGPLCLLCPPPENALSRLSPGVGSSSSSFRIAPSKRPSRTYHPPSMSPCSSLSRHR